MFLASSGRCCVPGSFIHCCPVSLRGACASNWSHNAGVSSNSREDAGNTLRILVATDCHLGYMEKDEVRRHDSFQAFEEICSIAEKKKVSNHNPVCLIYHSFITLLFYMFQTSPRKAVLFFCIIHLQWPVNIFICYCLWLNTLDRVAVVRQANNLHLINAADAASCLPGKKD